MILSLFTLLLAVVVNHAGEKSVDSYYGELLKLLIFNHVVELGGEHGITVAVESI